MKDMEATKKNRGSSKQESTSISKEKNLCKKLLSSEKNVEKADYQVVHDIEKEDLLKILETKEGFTVVIGDYKISREFGTMEQAEKAIKEKSWEVVINMVGLIIHLNKQKNGN